jgi:hypothetical protein
MKGIQPVPASPMTSLIPGWRSSTPEKITDSSTSDIYIWKLVMAAARAASATLGASWVKSRCSPQASPAKRSMTIAELDEPVIVDAQHLVSGLVVVEAAGGAEDAVQHLGLDAVTVLVLEPQIGIGEAADAPLAVVIEPFRRHPIGTVDLARLVEPAGRAHAVHQPEGRALLGDPLRAALAVGGIRHAVFQSR